MSNTKNKPKADGLFCKRCKATSGVFFRGLCGNCWVERAEMAERLENALERACIEMSDHQCPEEYGLGIWSECATCKREIEDRYNVLRDVTCWKRYFLEGANR